MIKVAGSDAINLTSTTHTPVRDVSRSRLVLMEKSSRLHSIEASHQEHLTVETETIRSYLDRGMTALCGTTSHRNMEKKPVEKTSEWSYTK